MDEVICSPIRLSPGFHYPDGKTSGAEWEAILLRGVEVLLLAPKQHNVSRVIHELPLVCIPPKLDREEYILESIAKITGIALIGSEVVFLNAETSEAETNETVFLEYSRRRPVAVVILRIRGSPSLSRGDRSVQPQFVPLSAVASFPCGGQSGQTLHRVSAWMRKACPRPDALKRLFTPSAHRFSAMSTGFLASDANTEWSMARSRLSYPLGVPPGGQAGDSQTLPNRPASSMAAHNGERRSSTPKKVPVKSTLEPPYKPAEFVLPAGKTYLSMSAECLVPNPPPRRANSDRGNHRAVDLPCDLVVTNPMRTAGLSYSWKVDICVRNPFWRLASGPNRTEAGPRSMPTSDKFVSYSQHWAEDFPLHHAAYLGDAILVSSLLGQGHLGIQRDRVGWAPVHYAAWYGRVKALAVLLTECSVNVNTDPLHKTPLHLAAMAGRTDIVATLLECKDINLRALDSSGSSALNYCNRFSTEEHRRCTELIANFVEKPLARISVHLIEGSTVNLTLTDGHETTVKQLQHQMMTVLDIPETSFGVFGFWICSASLHLQLKEEHRPVQHLSDWRSTIVPSLTDADASKEEPRLCWKRDATLSVEEEKKIKHHPSLNLLFYEAYHNYIQSLYPCANQDAVLLGTLLLHIRMVPDGTRPGSPLDTKKVKSFLSNHLHTVVPKSKLKSRGTNWSSLLLERFKKTAQSFVKKRKEDLQYRFLSLCWNLTIYGSAFFTAQITLKSSKKPVSVLVGVNDFGLHIVHRQLKTMLQSYPYRDILWVQDPHRPVLDVRWKTTNKATAQLHTKQAVLVAQLMNKMCSLHQG